MFSSPRRPATSVARSMQLPLAILLVSLSKPRVIVELNSNEGDLYSAFCQAVQELHLETQCYGFRQSSANSTFRSWSDLCAFNDSLYGSFSQLSEVDEAEAQARFDSASIDLLHIDNALVDDSLEASLTTWLPKMSEQGLVLIHNIGHRQTGQLWSKLKSQFGSVEIGGEYGLGILAVGRDAPPVLGGLLDLDRQSLISFRDLLHQLGHLKSKSDPIAAPETSETEASRAQNPMATEDQAAALAKIKALETTIAEQTTHLDLLKSQIDLMSERETELRTRFLEAHSQLNERDDALLLVTREQKAIAWLKEELALTKDEIRRMQATRLWQLAELYRRIFKRKSFEFRITDPK